MNIPHTIEFDSFREQRWCTLKTTLRFNKIPSIFINVENSAFYSLDEKLKEGLTQHAHPKEGVLLAFFLFLIQNKSSDM